MKTIVLLVLLGLGSLLNAQIFEIGVVLDSIPVANSDNETFALYLPKSYNSAELSPILFIFSPAGNGKKGVDSFIDAAEKYNHILVCSNNSKNGPLDRNFAIAERLFNHVFSNFNINENGVYLAGFSGGSRLVTAIATVNDLFKGVIACGAGFSSVPSYMPSTQNFSYAGLCGDRDMNYMEMIDVQKYLNRLKLRNTLFTFDGGHKWPPSEQILMAFDWLEIESQKKGHLKIANSEVLKSYTKNLERAKIALNNRQPLLSAEYYERAVNTYGSFFNLDSIRQKLKNLKKSKDYINTLKLREQAFKKEVVLTSSFLNRLDKDYENPEKANLKWWEREFEKLNKQIAKTDSEMPKMIERLRFKVFVAAYMKNNSEGVKPTENQLSFCKAIISQLYPKQKEEEL